MEPRTVASAPVPLPPAPRGALGPRRPSRPAAGPTTAAERAWAPDLARGAVLLGIALANVGLYLHGTELGPGARPVDGSALDRTLDLVVTLVVNDRSRPMFALLFGFGLATMVRRLAERGLTPREQRRVVVRRQLWLVVFGTVHAALLFEGDILGMYGATGLVVLLLLHRRPRVLVARRRGQPAPARGPVRRRRDLLRVLGRTVRLPGGHGRAPAHLRLRGRRRHRCS